MSKKIYLDILFSSLTKNILNKEDNVFKNIAIKHPLENKYVLINKNTSIEDIISKIELGYSVHNWH